MLATRRFWDEMAVASTINPASLGTGEALTGAIDMSKYDKVVFVIQTGVLGASATIDFVVKGATTSGGVYTAIPGTAITAIPKASGDNVVAMVEVRGETVGMAGYSFIKGSLTVGTAASIAGVVAYGFLCNYGPASKINPATVVQTVAA